MSIFSGKGWFSAGAAAELPFYSFKSFKRWQMVEKFRCLRQGCPCIAVLNIDGTLKDGMEHHHPIENLALDTKNKII